MGASGVAAERVETPRVMIGPTREGAIVEAVKRAGGIVVDSARDATMIVWSAYRPEKLAPLLHPGVRWVQLSSAGVEGWLASGLVDETRTWLSGADTHSENMAEHALTLVLAMLRRIPESAAARHWDRGLEGRTLRGLTVAVVGAGGIGRALIALLQPFGVDVIAVTRRGVEVAGAGRTLPADRVAEVWPIADVVVIAAPATRETYHLIDADVLAALPAGAVVVNVARGPLIDTDALLHALDGGHLGGAALDVTDPEPLPDGHPLWTHPRALITPHVGNPQAYWVEELAARVEDNVGRIVAGREPVAVVDLERGY
jgi:D-3-phosphoglycerate dehydrogenase